MMNREYHGLYSGEIIYDVPNGFGTFTYEDEKGENDERNFQLIGRWIDGFLDDDGQFIYYKGRIEG